jgi:26S proteasome regulatory subunit T4
VLLRRALRHDVVFTFPSDFEAVCRLADGFNGADMRNVCTEAGMFAIRGDRDYVLEEDFMKAARKIAESKKLESKLDYTKV